MFDVACVVLLDDLMLSAAATLHTTKLPHDGPTTGGAEQDTKMKTAFYARFNLTQLTCGQRHPARKKRSQASPC